MSYIATVPVKFHCSRHSVYEALCDLGSYPKWNSGMTSISLTERMHVGLEYFTTSDVLGQVNKAKVKVVDMIPDEAIVLESAATLITFRAAFQLKELEPKTCTVICNLRFEFSKVVFNLARPLVESMAEERIRGDLETLRDILRVN
jgi:ribosome-associated toxin RatA of RatAB toxin-antitoxin module